jgi:hypothetical protein
VSVNPETHDITITGTSDAQFHEMRIQLASPRSTVYLVHMVKGKNRSARALTFGDAFHTLLNLPEPALRRVARSSVDFKGRDTVHEEFIDE